MGNNLGFLLKQLGRQCGLTNRALAQLDKEISAHNKLKEVVMALAVRNGTCWCGVKSVALEFKGEQLLLHTPGCDNLFLALYGAERGE